MRNDVTPIEDLVNLDEKVIREREDHMNKIKNKSIRNLGSKGGMLEYEKMYNTETIQHNPSFDMKSNHDMQKYNPQRMYDEQFYTPTVSYMQETQKSNNENNGQMDKAPFNCIDVSHHIQGCPICSKLYQNDKSVYIAIIAILIILCLILFKKVLDKNY